MSHGAAFERPRPLRPGRPLDGGEGPPSSRQVPAVDRKRVRDVIKRSRSLHSGCQVIRWQNAQLGQLAPFRPLRPRRQLTKDQRRELWAAMRAEGMSYRQIAEADGTASKDTVQRDLSAVSNETPEKITGADGRSRPCIVFRDGGYLASGFD